jgi:hypothetical protein
MKKVFISIICLFLSILLSAEHISFEEAHMIAKNFTKNLRAHFKDDVTLRSGDLILREGIEVAYVFHFKPRGYMIVSAEDYLPPIKMYSLKNNFGKEGKPLEDFIFNQYLEIINKVNASVIDPETYFMEKNRRDFRLLTRKLHPLQMPMVSAAALDVEVEEVQPLLATTWYQREPYNLKCPIINNQRSVTGCVATAFAQVMKYHEYPDSGQGSWSYHTYTHNVEVSTSFNHPYYWDRMLNNYPTPDSGSVEQREAISQLMFDVGVSLSMDYSPDGSGASSTTAVITFPIFFKYSKDIIYVSRLGRDDAEWFDLAKTYVDRGLPVAFAIYREEMGHMVVIDGYRISSGSTTFHINMGWGGSWDGYYSLNNIVVRGDRHYTILDWQSYVLNIIPPDSGIELPSLPFGATAHENRSLFLKEYFCEITWKGFPAEEENIDRYIIRKFDTYTLEDTVFAEVDHTGQADLYHYTFRGPEYNPDVFFIYAVTHDNEWKLLMCCNLVLK